jgi:hypothetical protein
LDRNKKDLLLNFKKLSTTFFALFIAVSFNATAGLIVDNGTDKVTIGGACSSCNGFGQVFDDFTLLQSYELSYMNIDFVSFYHDDVEFSIWNSDLSVKLFSFEYTWDIGTFVMNFDGVADNVTATVSLQSSLLEAGKYYVSFLGKDTSSMISPTDDGNTFIQHKYAGMSDYSTTSPEWVRGDNIHFRMYAKVPEPSTIAIFALGIIALVSRRYKK